MRFPFPTYLSAACGVMELNTTLPTRPSAARRIASSTESPQKINNNSNNNLSRRRANQFQAVSAIFVGERKENARCWGKHSIHTSSFVCLAWYRRMNTKQRQMLLNRRGPFYSYNRGSERALRLLPLKTVQYSRVTCYVGRVFVFSWMKKLKEWHNKKKTKCTCP